MSNKRLFIAAPLPPEYIEIIARFRDQQEARYRWIDPENWHLTLMFLGSFPEDHIDDFQKFLSNFFASESTITLTPKAFIFAPKLKKARMIWLRFHEATAYDQLCKQLFEDLQNWYAERAIPFNLQLHERQIPHVTLARFKPLNTYNHLFLKGKNLVEALPKMTIQQANLYESILKPEGAVYHNLASFEFGRKNNKTL